MHKTAGLLIIGDEILKGQTQDTNSYYMCKTLRSIGIKVEQIGVIGDDVGIIASEVQKYASMYDYVLTSGGIGPTHDDMTYEAVAQAFDQQLHMDPTLTEMCKKYFGNKPADSPEMKLALVPTSSQLYFGMDPNTNLPMKFPLVFIKNVYIFPGIPVLLERQMDQVKNVFAKDGCSAFNTHEILVNDVETNIASVLTECTKKYKDSGLTIGSYPDWFNNYYKVKLIVECSDESKLKEAVEYLNTNLPACTVLQSYKPFNLKEDALSMFEPGYFDKYSPTLGEKFNKSVEIIEEALTRYKPEEICIGFNGGKDCTALLHLYYCVAYKLDKARAENLLSLFIKTDEPFEEISRFMKDTCNQYGLSKLTYQGSMKSQLTLMSREKPQIKSVIMGTRATDPRCHNLKPFAPTDGDWPPYVRVNPILNWTYHDIWTYLRSLQLPYCVLYDRGYTSLGAKDKTLRNSQLKYVTGDGVEKYKPAYTLQQGGMERSGRCSSL